MSNIVNEKKISLSNMVDEKKDRNQGRIISTGDEKYFPLKLVDVAKINRFLQSYSLYNILFLS